MSNIYLDWKRSSLKMASAQVVETSVTNNSPSQDFNHPDDLFQSRYFCIFNIDTKEMSISYLYLMAPQPG